MTVIRANHLTGRPHAPGYRNIAHLASIVPHALVVCGLPLRKPGAGHRFMADIASDDWSSCSQRFPPGMTEPPHPGMRGFLAAGINPRLTFLVEK